MLTRIEAKQQASDGRYQCHYRGVPCQPRNCTVLIILLFLCVRDGGQKVDANRRADMLLHGRCCMHNFRFI